MFMKVGLTLIAIMSAIAVVEGSTYYYGDDGPITLFESDSIITIKTYSEYEFQDWMTLSANFEGLVDTIIPLQGILGYDIYYLKEDVDVHMLLDSLNDFYMVFEALPVYQTSNGGIGLTKPSIVGRFIWDTVC